MRSVMRDDGYRVFGDSTIIGKRGRPLTPAQDKDGYYRVLMNKRPTLVHRVLAQAFMPNPEDKPTVNHIDGVKTNNALSNLEWATHRENTRHAWDTGLAPRGSKRVQAKLTDEDVVSIRRSFKDHCRGWQRATAKKYGVSRRTIAKVVAFETYTST